MKREISCTLMAILSMIMRLVSCSRNLGNWTHYAVRLNLVASCYGWADCRTMCIQVCTALTGGRSKRPPVPLDVQYQDMFFGIIPAKRDRQLLQCREEEGLPDRMRERGITRCGDAQNIPICLGNKCGNDSDAEPIMTNRKCLQCQELMLLGWWPFGFFVILYSIQS